MNLADLRARLGIEDGAPVRVGPGYEVELVEDRTSRPSGGARLIRVTNPFGRAKQDLNRLFTEDPAKGAEVLETLVQEVRGEIEGAIGDGADGIAYFLLGADAEHCSPMQYGGLYLERDRELLEYARSLGLNMLVVVGGPGAYIEIVADLPAAIMAWDVQATGRSVQDVRAIRDGLLCGDDESADLHWMSGSLADEAMKRGEAIA